MELSFKKFMSDMKKILIVLLAILFVAGVVFMLRADMNIVVQYDNLNITFGNFFTIKNVYIEIFDKVLFLMN